MQRVYRTFISPQNMPKYNIAYLCEVMKKFYRDSVQFLNTYIFFFFSFDVFQSDRERKKKKIEFEKRMPNRRIILFVNSKWLSQSIRSHLITQKMKSRRKNEEEKEKNENKTEKNSHGLWMGKKRDIMKKMQKK